MAPGCGVCALAASRGANLNGASADRSRTRRVIGSEFKTQGMDALANERASEPPRAERGSRGPASERARESEGRQPLGVKNGWLSCFMPANYSARAGLTPWLHKHLLKT